MSTTQNTTVRGVPSKTTEKNYQNEGWLKYQYHELGRTQSEVAEIAGCSRSTIQYWIKKFGLQRPESATFTDNGKGYEQWRCREGDKIQSITVHRLLATLKVDDLEELDRKHVHHKSHIPWLNTLEGIEVMEPSEHREHHRSDEKPEIPGEFR